MFDKITTIKIRTENDKENNPHLFDTLIERTEFYGIKRELFTSVEENFLPIEAIVGIFYKVVADNLGHPNTKMKSVWYPELEGIEYQLGAEPKKALELTQKVRELLPEESVKRFNSYLKIPA